MTIASFAISQTHSIPHPLSEHVDELVMDVSHLMDPFKLAVA